MLTGTDAFFDELHKIATAGDLTTPAVVSDSATVDGPPAAPFVRRKNFKKLEHTFPKEAGFGKAFLAVAKERLTKAKEKVDDASRKVYVKMPRPVQKALIDPSTMDPSDQRMGAAAQAAKQLLKIGSNQKHKQ